jgi:DNA repair protein RecN (Recombination protein N)
MLSNLHISNIVLIDRLDIEFGPGLNVLTGETGAGKSILLDALALSLGARSDTSLVRIGNDSATVSATFEFKKGSDELFSILSDNGIELDDQLILRRTLSVDGKSRAWINDIPVSVKVLKSVGDALVEIHGQFENHSLLDPVTHGRALDEFGGYDTGLVAAAYREWKSAEKELRELKEMLERSAAERDYIEFNLKELEALNPQSGEEEILNSSRAVMMDAEKNAAVLNEAVATFSPNGRALDVQVFAAAHVLERIKTDPNPYQEKISRLYEIGDELSSIAESLSPEKIDIASLESLEERLFAIRAAARKHRVQPDELHSLRDKMRSQLEALQTADISVEKLTKKSSEKKSEFLKLGAELTKKRIAAAADMRAKILKELPDLKLGAADFEVSIQPGAESAVGMDDIVFNLRTNLGMPFSPLHKSASGGEMSRIMLALRVVLSNNGRIFVFDELDTGISGATAAAVGERMARLSTNGQILAITHSAQVSGFADHHFKISKSSAKNTTTATVEKLSGGGRINEIARILSAEKITDESIAAAKKLLKN